MRVAYIQLCFILKIWEKVVFQHQTPNITFDQPLWLKTVEIVSSKKPNVVVNLGVFDCLMSFVESVGASMEGPGLEKPLQQVYGANAVSHMMSGKAISRAL